MHDKDIDILYKSLFFFYDSTNKNMYRIIKIGLFWYLNQVLAFLLDLNVAIGDNINSIDAIEINNEFKIRM